MFAQFDMNVGDLYLFQPPSSFFIIFWKNCEIDLEEKCSWVLDHPHPPPHQPPPPTPTTPLTCGLSLLLLLNTKNSKTSIYCFGSHSHYLICFYLYTWADICQLTIFFFLIFLWFLFLF